MELQNQLNQQPNQDNLDQAQQIYNVPLEPRKALDRLDLLSVLGDVVTVTGAAVSYFERISGPITSGIGIFTTQLTNYYINKKKRDENQILEDDLNRARETHPNINVQLPKLDKFGLKSKGCWPTTSTVLTAFFGGAGTALAVIYNAIGAEKGDKYEIIMLASIAAGLAALIAERILQHYKTDNLNRQEKVYERASRFFPAPLPNAPAEDVVQQNPANAPGI